MQKVPLDSTVLARGDREVNKVVKNKLYIAWYTTMGRNNYAKVIESVEVRHNVFYNGVQGEFC